MKSETVAKAGVAASDENCFSLKINFFHCLDKTSSTFKNKVVFVSLPQDPVEKKQHWNRQKSNQDFHFIFNLKSNVIFISLPVLSKINIWSYQQSNLFKWQMSTDSLSASSAVQSVSNPNALRQSYRWSNLCDLSWSQHRRDRRPYFLGFLYTVNYYSESIFKWSIYWYKYIVHKYVKVRMYTLCPGTIFFF